MDNVITFAFDPFGLLVVFKRNGQYMVKPEFKCDGCKLFSLKEMEAKDFIKECSIILSNINKYT